MDASTAALTVTALATWLASQTFAAKYTASTSCSPTADPATASVVSIAATDGWVCQFSDPTLLPWAQQQIDAREGVVSGGS